MVEKQITTEQRAPITLAKSLVLIAEAIASCDDWQALEEQTKLADSAIWTAFQHGDLAADPVLTNRVEHMIALNLERGGPPPDESGLMEYLIGQTVRLPNFSHEQPWREVRECANWFHVGLCDVARRLHGADSANSANTSRLFCGEVPTKTDLVDLAVLLDAEKSKPASERRSWNEIARKFKGETNGDDKKAKSLLSQLRRMKREGRVNL